MNPALCGDAKMQTCVRNARTFLPKVWALALSPSKTAAENGGIHGVNVQNKLPQGVAAISGRRLDFVFDSNILLQRSSACLHKLHTVFRETKFVGNLW
jgi:hypothetical protein